MCLHDGQFCLREQTGTREVMFGLSILSIYTKMRATERRKHLFNPLWKGLRQSQSNRQEGHPFGLKLNTIRNKILIISRRTHRNCQQIQWTG